jgi:signal transduction histidine kinase
MGGAGAILAAFAACALTIGAGAYVVGRAAGRRAARRNAAEHARLERRHALFMQTSDLVTSVDHEVKLAQQLTRLFVPELADFCTVDLLEPSGDTVFRAAAAHRDPGRVPALMAAPMRPWRNGRPVITLAGNSSVDAPAGHASSLAVPLHGRRGVIGVLTLGMAGSRRRLDADQLRLARDVAAQSALAIENAALFRQTVEASRAKDEFLAVLGHELRNPLAPMVTALSLMEMKGYAGLEKEYRVLERQVRHMSRLVDDLLDVTRIARGKMELRFDAVDLAEAVGDGVELVKSLLASKSLLVEIDVGVGRFALRGDRTRLAQAVANLLHNAAKWSSPGQKVELHAEADAERGGVALTIRDRGAGISSELLPRIFDLFAQAPQTRERASGGLGIGLALVKSVVGLHDGTVTASSDGPGHGSLFTVWLPTTAGAPAAVAKGAPAPAPRAASAPDGRGVRVLLVDDNIDAAESMGEMLRARAFDVRVAHDGPTALRAVGEFRPDVALLDIGLPAMDGHELGEQLAKRVPGIRLIAVTGYALPADLARSRTVGFERHLAKPVDWSALQRALLGPPPPSA